MANNKTHFTFLIIGGGIAGITCAETLYQYDQSTNIGLITASDTVKTVTNLQRITKLIENFKVVESSIDALNESIPTLNIIKGIVEKVNPYNKYILLNDGKVIYYSKLCICTGGKPQIIFDKCPYIVGIRDTDSVIEFKSKLKDCRKIVVVGNGGIASELVYEIINCEIIWVIRDKSISSHFLDNGAAKFLLNNYQIKHETSFDHGADKVKLQRHHYSTFTIDVSKSEMTGGALGPDWAQKLQMEGNSKKKLDIIYEAEVVKVIDDELELNQMWNDQCPYKVCCVLTNGKKIFCDLIVSATGVLPQYPLITSDWKLESTNEELKPIKFDIDPKDGGIKVNEFMETNIQDIYAAGDCCYANWKWSNRWFQMRLWSQARNMAFQAALCMIASINGTENPWPNFSFELFTHITKLFGYSIVLLGKYNDGHGKHASEQQWNYDTKELELWIRTSPEKEYLKLVVIKSTGQIIGATLIGDTELSETIEDLILDEIDVSMHKEALLDPNIDIADYFD